MIQLPASKRETVTWLLSYVQYLFLGPSWKSFEEKDVNVPEETKFLVIRLLVFQSCVKNKRFTGFTCQFKTKYEKCITYLDFMPILFI